MGYEVAEGIFVSNEYGSPQRRKRAYVLAISTASGEKRGIATKAMRLALGFKCSAPDLMSFVLDDGDEYLEREFQRQKTRKDWQDCLKFGSLNVGDQWIIIVAKTKHSSESQEVDIAGVCSELPKEGGSEDKQQNWKANYQKILQNKGMAMSSLQMPKEARSRWYELLPERCQVVLGHAFHDVPGLRFVDCYQSLGREFTSSEPAAVSTIVPGSKIWSVQHKRLLLGKEVLAIQMMPLELLDVAAKQGVSDHQMADLAGNSFTGSVFGSVALAALTCAPLQDRAGSLNEASALAFSVSNLLGL
eukprot:6492788-Amphidinium_carterae.3